MNNPSPETAAAPDPVREAKQRLRQAARARRRQLQAAAGAEAARRLAGHVFEALAPAAGTVVSGFWPMRDEIDPRPLLARLAAEGCVCALPVIAGPDQPLLFRRWEPGTALVAGPFGTSEPPAEAEPVTPEILLVPLLAFDRAGHRLGYGGGYYDRTLAALRAERRVTAMGLAFAGQEVDQVPHDRTDAPLDAVATEAGVILIPKAPGVAP